MYKRISIVFSIILILLMLLTCVFGVKAIGKSLYLYVKTIGQKSFADSVDNFFETVDDAFTKNFCLRDSCISAYGLIQKFEGKNIVEDASRDKTVLLGDDGKLYFRGGVTDELNAGAEIGMQENVNRLNKLNDFCHSNDVNLLYVIAPHKYSGANVSLPESRKDYTQDTYTFSKMLSKAGIENINLMAELLDAGRYNDAFFITDHHWNIKTAFWGFGKICEKMNSAFESGINAKLYSADSYEIITYPNCYLGSMGVRVGRFYAGMDDIDAISPLFETRLSISFESKTLKTENKRTGDFKETVFADNAPGYHMYITSDNSLVYVDNELIDNNNKTLIIKDSFGVPVSAWMACCFDELWIMDLRYAQNETVKDFIDNHEIDNVIILYNPEVMRSSTMYEFGLSQ